METTKKVNGFTLRLGVLAMPFVFVSYAIYGVVLADMIAAFPEVDPTVVQMVLSVPAMFAVAGVYLPSFLNYWISRKRMAQAALLMQAIIGLVMLLFGDRNIYIMLAGVGVLGLGYGIIATNANLIINSLFDGDNRTKMMGWYSAANNTGKPIYSFLAGFIALISWKYISILHLINGISFILVSIFVPNDKPLKELGMEKTKTSDKPKSKLVITFPVIYMFFNALMYGIFAFVRASQSSLYIVGYELGNSATTGTLNSITLIIALPMALFFGKFYKIFKEKIMFVGWILTGVTYIFCGMSISLLGIYVGTVGGNILQNIIFPCCGLVASLSVPEESRTVATSLCVSAISIGVFLSPIVVNGIARFVTDMSPAQIWVEAGVVSLAMAVLTLIYSKPFKNLDKKHE